MFQSNIKKLFLSILVCTFLTPVAGFSSSSNSLDDESVQGLYKAVLLHDGTQFFQYAHITLRTVNVGGGQLKISANLRIFFGEQNSNEFLTYEFDDVPMNLLTRQITLRSEKNNVSMIGFLKTGTIQGEWHSTLLGKVGKFSAAKDVEPTAPTQGILVKTLTGHYRGELKNTNSESNLPERASMSLVSTQENSGTEPKIVISGNVRLYLGPFGSLEYVETKLTDVQFNFYNRYLTARTLEYGLTFKGKMSHDGIFTGTVFADGMGQVADATLTHYP